MMREEYVKNDISVQVTASMGVSICPEDGTTYEELFKKADEALYEVKQKGKDGFKLS
jgi:diguanylate cyclase (GGDEF)-like protein